MSSRAIVEIECVYQPMVAGGPPDQFGSENYPLRLDAFGTHELDWRVRQQVMSDSANEHRLSISFPRAPRGSLSQGADLWRRPFRAAHVYMENDDSESGDTFSASAAIIVNAYATTMTKARQRCWTTAGTAVLPLAVLLTAKDDSVLEFGVWQNRDNTFPFDARDVGFKHALQKGKLLVRRVRFPSGAPRLRNPTKYDVDADNDIGAAAAVTLCAQIDRGMAPFFGKNAEKTPLGHPTMPFLLPFHVPEYRTPRKPLASSAYCLHMPYGVLDVPYYENLLDIALARGGLTRDEAMQLASTRSAYYEQCAFASLAVRTVCIFALSQCYLDDFLNKNGQPSRRGMSYNPKLIETDEDFKLCRLLGADDCEGVALEIMMHIRQLTTAPEQLVDRMSPLLREVARFFEAYVPALLLGCVTNRKMTAAQLNQECALAHTFCAIFPRDVFNSLARTRGVSQARTHQSLPVLFAEGTAPIDPAMRPVSVYYAQNETEAKQAAFSAAEARRDMTNFLYEALSGAGVEYAGIESFGPPDTPNQDYSAFYKYVVSMASPQLAGERKLDWAFVDQRKESFGVTANAVLDGNTAAIAATPFLVYTEHEARLTDAILQDQQPIPNLELDRGDGNDVVCNSEYKERLERCAVATSRRTPPVNRGTVLHRRRTFITTRVQDIDDAFCTALERISQSSQILGLSYQFYQLHRAVDGTQANNCILDVYIEF